ncbi:MAG: prolyl oligopeptidase family serine peptidase [Acidobacteriota bacterium]
MRIGRVRQPIDQLPVRMEQRELRVDAALSVTYGVLVPKAAPPANGYPLIVGLHYATAQEPGLAPYFGLGYVGQLVYPALKALDAVIVAPDAPEATWSHPASARAVRAIVGDVRGGLAVDMRRTLVTGFSMGGYGAWYLAATAGDLFKAAIPIAALPLVTPARTTREVQAAVAALAANDDWTTALTAVPVHVIHSRADDVVPFESAERAVRVLAGRGGQVTLTALDGVPHHIVAAYVDPLAAAVPWVREAWGR